MASLHDKVQNALDEGRILVLGVQVLLGFEYRSFFEARFEALPDWAKAAKLVALCTMLLAFALVVLPASFHRLVARGEDRPDVHEVTTGVLAWALLPIALGFALDVAVSVERVLGERGAAAMGIAAAATALGAWYGATGLARRRRRLPRQEAKMEPTNLDDKIRHVLTEARMILPGAQALLGFQLAVTLTEPFDALPGALQRLHVAALALVGVAVVLLILPAAYHRIVERGEETEHFHRFASAVLLAAMVFLALGLSADLYVVSWKVLDSGLAAGVIALGALALFGALWFGLPLVVRARRGRVAARASARPAAAHR